MILRRFMKHVTDQNWFAVGLDVIVVIVGIYLGLQVQEWSIERQEKAEEYQYLARLHDDVVDSINQNKFRAEFMERQTNYTRTMLDDLSTCNLPPENEFVFANGLYTIGKSLPAVFANTVMDELNSTGKMLIIKNVSLRKELAKHVVYINEAIDIDNKVMARATADVVEIENKFTFNINRANIGTKDIDASEVIYDFNALCKDEDFRRSISLVRAYVFEELARVILAIEQQQALKAMIEVEMKHAQ